MGLCVEFSTLTEMFSKLAKKFASETRPLLMHKTQGSYRGIGYTDLYNRAESCALGFREIGIKEGDKVALISENRPEWVVADMGLMHLGAVSVPLYPTMTAKQFDYVFTDA